MYDSRCTIRTSDGRRCTSQLYSGHATLCHLHLRQQLDGAPPSDDVAADILQSIQNFQSAASINAALGKILAMLASGRIKRQDALSMAYICQLLLQSLKEFKHEIRLTTYEKFFERDLLKVLNARTPLEEFVYPPPPEEPEPEPEELESENPEQHHSESVPSAAEKPPQSDENEEQTSSDGEPEADEQSVNELEKSDQSEENEELETEKMEV